MASEKFDSSFLESEAVQAVIAVISRKVTEAVIAEHIKSCPHGQKLATRIALLCGVALGSGIAGGGLVLTIAKAVATGSP